MKKFIFFIALFFITTVYAQQNIPYVDIFETTAIKDNHIIVNAKDFVKESELAVMLSRGFVYAFYIAQGRVNESYLVVCLVVKEKNLVYMYRVRAIDIQLLLEKRITEEDFDQRIESKTVSMEEGKNI